MARAGQHLARCGVRQVRRRPAARLQYTFSASQERWYCSDDDAKKPGSSSSYWSSMNVQSSRAPSEEAFDDELTADMVPKSFNEYLEYCEIINAIDVPDLLQKEGLPAAMQDVVEALDRHNVLQYMNDDGFYYLIMAGWMPEMLKHEFRVFQDRERERLWKAMTKVLEKTEDQWGPKTMAAIMHCASALGYTEQVLHWYQQAHSKGCLSRYSFPSVMYGLGHDKDIDRASHIFQWVDKKGSRGEDYRAFIFANAKVGNWRDARYYYETYKKTRPGEPPNDADLRLMTTLLAAYARGRNSGGAEVLYDEICRKYRPSDTLTTTLITSYANGSIRGFNKARVLFMKSFDLTFTPSANAWMKVMLNLYASLSAVAGERQDEVEKKLEPAKVFTYADSITRLAAMKARYLEDRFWRLYEIMRRFPTHYKPDAITYFHCLQFARASRRPERAIEVLRAAGEDGIKHTAYYNLVLGAHSKVLDSASTYQYFREMRAEQIPINAQTYVNMTEGLMPGQGTNNTLVLMDTMKRSKLNPTAAFLAYCLRVFSTKEGVHHFVQVCRQAVTLSSGVLLEGSEENVAASVTKSFVLDSPWLFHCLERPLRELDFSNAFHSEFPDFSERMFETVAAPVLYFRSPRPAALTQDDLKQQMTVGGGTTIWILSDEWMLPFGDRLRECIADIIAAKDRIIVPYYCMMRLGRIVRRGQSNTQLREAAFNVLQILQELFDASAEATERGEPVIADTLFFNEQLWSHDLFRSVLEKQDVPERDKDSIAALSERPIRYDIELEFAGSLSERPTVKYLSRRSIVYALEIKQMQMQRTSVIFCARNSEHLKLAKKLGLDCHSVEDVLGPDWLKHRREEDEKLMLSWKGPEDRLAIEAAPFQALTASSFAENAYWQGDHNVVSLEDTPPPAAGKAPAQADDMASYTPPTRSDNAAAAATEPHSAAPQDDAAPAHTASPPETPRHSDAAAKDTLSEEAEGSAAPAAPFDPESPRAAGEAAQGDSTAEPQPANAAPTPGEAAESAENPTDLGARPEDAEGSSAPAGSLDPKEAARRVSTAEPHKSTWGAIKTKAASPPAQEEDVADYKPAESKKPE